METNKPLKALLLVGGFGTRLRPLTFSKSKPLVEFMNKPIIIHQIEALKAVGVSEIVLAINYQPENMYDFIKDIEAKYSVKVTCSKEEEPLGTGGPIGLAKKILLEENTEEIFVFNSDVTCRFPLKDMLDFHRKHGKEGTIAITKVKDPSKFGVILYDKDQKILDFVEKPQNFVGDEINAGLYIFTKKFLDRVNPVPTSIERDIFPQMAKEGELYAFKLEGFWADIGQPRDYLAGTNLYLNDLSQTNKDHLVQGAKNVVGNVVIDPTAKVSDTAKIGPNVVIGPGAVIESGARVKNSVVLGNTQVSCYSYVDGSILGWKSKVGKWTRIENMTILGEEVTVADEIQLNGITVLPNVSVKTSQNTAGTIIMC